MVVYVVDVMGAVDGLAGEHMCREGGNFPDFGLLSVRLGVRSFSPWVRKGQNGENGMSRPEEKK